MTLTVRVQGLGVHEGSLVLGFRSTLGMYCLGFRVERLGGVWGCTKEFLGVIGVDAA